MQYEAKQSLLGKSATLEGLPMERTGGAWACDALAAELSYG
jgi:hypothetical protein